MSVLLSNCFRPQCLFITATETKVEQAGETNLNFEKNSWLPKDHMWFCNSEVLGFLSFETGYYVAQAGPGLDMSGFHLQVLGSRNALTPTNCLRAAGDAALSSLTSGKRSPSGATPRTTVSSDMQNMRDIKCL